MISILFKLSPAGIYDGKNEDSIYDNDSIVTSSIDSSNSSTNNSRTTSSDNKKNGGGILTSILSAFGYISGNYDYRIVHYACSNVYHKYNIKTFFGVLNRPISKDLTKQCVRSIN